MPYKETYIEVILPVPVDNWFTYKVDETTGKSNEEELAVGQRVLVPFGPRMLVGVVRKVGVDKPDYNTKTVKQVIDSTPCMSNQLMKLLEWSSHYYFHPIGDVFKQFMPHKDIRLEINKFYRLSSYPIYLNTFSDKENAVINYLTNKKYVSKNTLIKRFNQDIINRLLKKSVLEVVFKTPDQILEEPSDSIVDSHNSNTLKTFKSDIILTEEQKNTVDLLVTDLQTRTFQTTLVMGVTGSGKTEIYMQVIAEAIKKGKNAIVLVPEIALTPQLVNRFIDRFGIIIGVIHSKIKPLSLKKTYADILKDRIRIIIGVRSAIFAPIKHVGVIVVDEEHEHTYKQEDRFRYNARDVAIMRGKLEQALVVLGSATPSLESYYNAITGKYKFCKLEHRIHNLPMPEIHIVDLKKEHPHRIGNEILTKPVVDALSETFSKNKQAIIMLNRRGYASSLICGDCGHVEKCPECDIPLTYHKSLQRLVCHYCGYSEPIFSKCPVCGSSNVKLIGIGTQRLEEEIKKIFNSIKSIRMDRDTTGRAGSHEKFIDMFGTRDVMILLGTQMVAKGLDFPDVELVCLPLLDIGLNIPDFRSSERIFNIIMQSAGRAGRAESGARVFIQTYNPDYYPIKYAVDYNTELFYKTELSYRKELFYPPFSRITLIIFKHKDLKTLQYAMEKIAKVLTNGLGNVSNGVDFFGPVPAPMTKAKGFYVYHLLLKSSKTKILSDVLHKLNNKFKESIPDIKFIIDMDPQHFM
jgi:primosomal protein N' (replication factor Y)